MFKRNSALKLQYAEKEKMLFEATQKAQKFIENETLIKKYTTQLQELDIERKNISINKDKLSRYLSNFLFNFLFNSLSNYRFISILIFRLFNEKDVEFKNAKIELKQKDDNYGGKINQIRSDLENLKRLSTNLNEIFKKCQQFNLHTIVEKLNEINRNITNKENDSKSFIPKINAINSEVTSQSRRKRNVSDNLDLRAAILEKKALEQNVYEIQEKSGGGEDQMRDAIRSVQRSEQDREKLKSAEDRLTGNIEAVSKQMIDLQKKLDGPNYKGIETRHRRKGIEYETTNMSVIDLQTYYDALGNYFSI